MIILTEWIFWFSAAAILYTFFGYPLLLLAVAPFRRRTVPDPAERPSVSVLIAAYNEQASIRRKVEETLAQKYPAGKLEVLVVSDGSTDGTDEIVKQIDDPRVRLLRVTGRRGKTYAQNEGVRECRGEIIVFSDATTVYHPESLHFLTSRYQDPSVGAVSGRYKYFDASGVSPTGLGSIAFWNYENLIKKLQSDIYSLTGCSGCIYSLRKSLYTPLPAAMLSDMVEPLCVLAQGYRIHFEDRAYAYEETTETSTQEFRMRVRIVTRGLSAVAYMSDLLKFWKHRWISFQLLSHKVLRWFVWLFLLGMFFSNLALLDQPLYRITFLLQCAFYVMAALSPVLRFHTLWKPLGIPLYFCTLHSAAMLGVYEFARGKRYVVWETVRPEDRATATKIGGGAQNL